MHILLHADDTIVLSTDHDLFMQCPNSSFKLKNVSLNLLKPGFMVINSDNESDRYNIKLDSGWLKYREEFLYLGAIFSDKGLLSYDLNLHVSSKSKSVYIKLANLFRNNYYISIIVKKKMLKSCLEAAILYECETWSSTSLLKLETLYRKVLKITFSMSKNTPNEIIYIETGYAELKAEIYKRQHKILLENHHVVLVVS